MQEEELQLQINLNIKDRKYLIRVPKSTDLSKLVQQFLVEHSLSPTYHAPIIRLVQQQLVAQQGEKSNTHSQVAHSESDSQATRKGESCKAVGEETVSNKMKNALLSKIQQELEANNRNPPLDSRKVYEQWKQKEREKTKHEKNEEKSCSPSRVAQREKHSPDYFYKKGLQFQQQCQQNCQAEFRKVYPFKINEKTLSDQQQRRLTDRLAKEKKEINVKSYLDRKVEEQHIPAAPRYDPVKMKVKTMDEQIDRALYDMLREKSTTPKKRSEMSRSPFRKTVMQ